MDEKKKIAEEVEIRETHKSTGVLFWFFIKVLLRNFGMLLV